MVDATFVHLNIFPSDQKRRPRKSWDPKFEEGTFRTDVVADLWSIFVVAFIVAFAIHCGVIIDFCGAFVLIRNDLSCEPRNLRCSCASSCVSGTFFHAAWSSR